MKKILDDGTYDLPASLDEAESPDKVADIQTNAINDRMIVIGQWFATFAFMRLWNTAASVCQRTDVRDAFISNYHRANRWHVAFDKVAVEKGYLKPLPAIPGSARQ